MSTIVPGQETYKNTVESIPFTSSQMWQLIETRNPDYFNDGSLMRVRYALDRKLLIQAVSYLIKYHDALRLRFSKDRTGWHQFLLAESDSEPSVHWIDLAHLPESDQRAAMKSWAIRLHTQINLLQGPTMQVAYFDFGRQKPGYMLWLLNHCIVDYFSFGILLEDFQTIYQQLISKQEACLPKKTTTFQQWTKQLNTFVYSVEMQREAEEYWLKAPWQNVVSLPTDYPDPQGKGIAQTDALKVQLSVKETEKLLRFAEILHLKIEDLFLLSVMRSFVQWTGSNWQQICMLHHGRTPMFEDIDLSRVVGSISLGSRLLLEWQENILPLKALESIQTQVAAIARRGIGFDWLYYLSPYREQLAIVPPPEIKLNYLGHVRQTYNPHTLFSSEDMQKDPGREVEITLAREPGDYRNPLSSIHIVAIFINSQLTFFWDYEGMLYKRSTIAIIAHRCLDYLRRCIDSIK